MKRKPLRKTLKPTVHKPSPDVIAGYIVRALDEAIDQLSNSREWSIRAAKTMLSVTEAAVNLRALVLAKPKTKKKGRTK